MDALFLRVVELPRRCFEVGTRAARHDFHVLAAESARGAAAVHGRVADADDQDTLTNLFDVSEMRRREPLDPDVDVAGVAATGDVEILARWRATADENCVIPFGEQRL